MVRRNDAGKDSHRPAHNIPNFQFDFLRMKFDNQLRYATEVIESFQGGQPLHEWLKQYFRDHPQMGSRDRKQLSELVYCYYRLGHAADGLSTKDRLLAGVFLCNTASQELLAYFQPAWNDAIQVSIEKKIQLLQEQGHEISIDNIFPWHDQLGAGIDAMAFCKSFLLRPDLFLRVRPGHEKTVIDKLNNLPGAHEWIGPAAIRLPNGFKTDQFFALNSEVVVQDLNSQRTGNYFLPGGSDEPIKAWDCCAASGGKSILLHDLHPAARLLVSDIRPSILSNLQKRFVEAGIAKYESMCIDLGKPVSRHDPTITMGLNRFIPFDLLLVDAPCSGSGTWARNPDELYFFRKNRIDTLSELQRRIVSNAVFSLKKKGRLVYITCSVFRNENETVAEYIQKTLGLNLEGMHYLKGYEDRADTLFVATFTS